MELTLLLFIVLTVYVVGYFITVGVLGVETGLISWGLMFTSLAWPLLLVVVIFGSVAVSLIEFGEWLGGKL